MKILLTGEPGVGKTTVVKKVVEQLGGRATGFWTEEIRDRKSGKRTGFKVMNTEGRESTFASKRFTSKHIVGSYGVNVRRFEDVTLPPLERYLREGKAKVLVIDGIGKMELFSKRFRELVKALAYDPRVDLLATLPIRDVHSLVRELRKLQGAVLIELKRSNREGMDKKIMKLLLD